MIVGRASLLMKARDMIVDGTIKMIPLMSSSKKKQKPLQKPKTKGMSGLINLTKVEPEESLEDNSTSFSSSLPHFFYKSYQFIPAYTWLKEILDLKNHPHPSI